MKVAKTNSLVLIKLFLVALLLSACSQMNQAPAEHSTAEAPHVRTGIGDRPTLSTTASGDSLTYYAQLDNTITTYVAARQGEFLADNFVVPTGSSWQITEVGFPTHMSSPNIGLSTYTIAFFAANSTEPDLPGNLLAERSYTAQNTFERDGLRIVPLSSSVELPAGTYWIGFDGWFIQQRTPPTGYVGVYGTVGSFSSANLPSNTDSAFALFGIPSVPPVLTVFENGAINRKTGFATVSGNMTCETPGTYAVQVEVRQRQAKTPVEGFMTINVSCNEATSWAAAVKPSKGSFKAGLADVAVETTGADPTNRVLRTVNLR